MKKLSEYNFTEEQIRAFYDANKGPINYFYGMYEEVDLLSSECNKDHVTTLVKSELRRIQDFKEVYPYMTNLLRESFQPSLDYISGRTDEYPFFDEDGSIEPFIKTIVEAAKANVGLLKWLPDHFRNNPTVLLTAYFSNRSSFMGLAAYMNPGAFKFISEDLWVGNYYKGQEHKALGELIFLAKQAENTNFLYQLPHLSEERYCLILNFFVEQLERPLTAEELHIFKSFRTLDPVLHDTEFHELVRKVFSN